MQDELELVKYTEDESTYVPRKGVKYFFKCFFKSKNAVISGIIITLFILMAILAPILSPNDPAKIELLKTMIPPVWAGGTPEFPLGTDSLGRCVMSRIFYGARVSLLVGAVSVAFSGVFGTAMGLLSGYFGGIVDDVIMRIAEILQAFPFMLLAIAILAVLGSGLGNVIMVLALTGWVGYARIVRSEVISAREADYVEATKALGLPTYRIIFGHILPNVMSSVIVIASFSFAGAIISEASLSFLGLGVSVNIPTWGQMISASRDYIFTNGYLMMIPSIMVVLVVLSINVFGDWIRDYLDPKTTNF